VRRSFNIATVVDAANNVPKPILAIVDIQVKMEVYNETSRRRIGAVWR